MLLATTCGWSQPNDPNNRLSLYQSARDAYNERQFQKSARDFFSVAEQCPGSELAIQCEYWSIMSEWSVEPCDDCANKLSAWLGKAKKFQADAKATGRSKDPKQLLKWTENAELLHAQWDRQKLRFELAEKRLRTFLGVSASEPKPSTSSPGAWLELGSLLLENRHDYSAARTCFDNVIQNSSESDPMHSNALLGCALSCWHSQQYAEARVFLERLSKLKIDDEIRIQCQLLQVKISKALGETADVVKALDPVIRIALASNPPASTLYELAMALIDAGEQSNSDELLVHLVRQYPKIPISIEARIRLARNATEQKRWKDAVEWTDQALGMDCPKELQPYAQLLRGQAKLELAWPDNAKADLEAALASSNGDLQLEVSIRFHLAETLYQLQRWQEADVYWKWLVQTAESSAGSANKTNWFPVVLLRSAELLALRKEWSQAEELVLRIRNDFPKCKRACEVDYLFARCLIAKADFDAARQILNSLTQQRNLTPDELVARSQWMMGETYLMQRRYSEALVLYQEVLKIPNQEHWSSASLLQIAQCCEAMQDIQGAKEAYETIIQRFSTSPFVLTAKERLSNIPSTTIANQQIKEQTSGTKR